MDTPHIDLSLELVAGAEPIRGRIVDDEGVAQPFHGWIELAVVLDRLRGVSADSQ